MHVVITKNPRIFFKNWHIHKTELFILYSTLQRYLFILDNNASFLLNFGYLYLTELLRFYLIAVQKIMLLLQTVIGPSIFFKKIQIKGIDWMS